MAERDWTPAQHYAEAVVLVENTNPTTALENLLKGLTHALLAGVRSDLDYQAKQTLSRAHPPGYGEPTFEEDDPL